MEWDDGLCGLRFSHQCQKSWHLIERLGRSCVLCAGDVCSVNPWDLNQLSDAIRYALTMSGEERMDHHAFAFQLVKKHTAQYWAESFLQALYSSAPSLHPSVVPPKLDVNEVVTAFKQARYQSVWDWDFIGAGMVWCCSSSFFVPRVLVFFHRFVCSIVCLV